MSRAMIAKLHLLTNHGYPLRGPHIIGAMGGSGTRVVARIARRGGMFIGFNLSRAEDAFGFSSYFNRWINPFMERSERWSVPALAIQDEMIQDLHALLENHCAPLFLPQEWEAWGWKVWLSDTGVSGQ